MKIWTSYEFPKFMHMKYTSAIFKLEQLQLETLPINIKQYFAVT